MWGERVKIIRVFPRRTAHTPDDALVFLGDPPLERPEADEVHVSCVFTWDKPAAERLQQAWAQYYPVVKLGGPAYDDPGDGFTPGMYLKSNITITSRGCNNRCTFCLVPCREGKIRELPIHPGNVIQDNNLLQCSPSHIDAVMDMLTTQKQVVFSGGLEAARVTERVAERIRGLRLHQVFMACDTPEAIKPLRKALNLLQINREKVRCYIILKHNPTEAISTATERLIDVFNAGALPFAQLCQPPDKHIEYPQEWRHLARTWSRPAAMKAFMKSTGGKAPGKEGEDGE